MKNRWIWEHNGADTILYSEELTGAFTRGDSLESASAKILREAEAYGRWASVEIPELGAPVIAQEKKSELRISDADSDVLFDSERDGLTMDEYLYLKSLALKSAADFLSLYESLPDKDRSVLPERQTFYGAVPRTAREMYEHTKNVNSYYFGEIDVDVDNDGTILDCRERGFTRLEQHPGFLSMPACEGSYGEEWSLRKVLRRFVWHDRIHARAMYRMAKRTFGSVHDVFRFDD